MTDWAIIYARVSTEEQAEKGYSLEAQVEDCLRKAEELGYARETVRILTDEVSGAGMDRPGLNRLRELTASAHKPACVIMYDPDRFARKLAHQLILTDEILKNKVGLEFVNFTWNNTAEGRMFYQLRGMFAEFEREKIKERTIRGRMAKIQNHGKLSCNPRLFGYTFDKEEDVLQPDPLTAPVVKEMFELAAEGRSAAAIARLLEAEGTPGPRGEAWHASTVSRILRNTSYLGTYMAYKVDYHQGFRRKRPVEEQFPLPLEALITEELFDRAQQALEKHRKHSGRPPEREYLLAGLGRCSCGRPMAADPGSGGRTSYYRCSGKKRSRSPAGRGKEPGRPATALTGVPVSWTG
ncbi:recombinase family protein [Paenibacillus sp. CC-CFT747]|nr:recombinase family protein [Paenibacillus sp. CC-CFT747]